MIISKRKISARIGRTAAVLSKQELHVLNRGVGTYVLVIYMLNYDSSK